jgi:flavin reductase (DIM6/NTAB) family NADH-FMN oxidoreductase RutF
MANDPTRPPARAGTDSAAGHPAAVADGDRVRFDPGHLTQAERYKLLTGAVVPRPIAWVSTRSPGGVSNLAPFSFYNAVGSDPMLVMFCPANGPDGSEKDSLRNAKPKAEGGSGEFVVNIVPHALAHAMNLTADSLAYEQSEFEHVGLAEAPCAVIAAARLAISPVSFECVTEFVHRSGPGVRHAGNLVLGRVVHVWLDPACANSKLFIDPAAIDLVARMGGFGYCTTRERFEMRRPNA